jgi:hypothetical protein
MFFPFATIEAHGGTVEGARMIGTGRFFTVVVPGEIPPGQVFKISGWEYAAIGSRGIS